MEHTNTGASTNPSATNAKPENTGFSLRVVRRSGREAQAVPATETIPCDSVRLYALDGANGQGGGCLGIRQGHVPAVIALGNHPVVALRGGQVVREIPLSGGIAVVGAGGHTVTVYPD
jgi:hypothetical protein